MQTLYEKKFIDPLWEPFILVLHASLANVKQCSYSTPYYKQIDGTIRPNFLGSLYACIMMEMNNLTKQGNCDGVAKLPLSCLISNLQQVFMFTSERIDMVERKLIKEGRRTGFLKRFQEHSPLTCCDVIDEILCGTPQQSMTNEKFVRKLRKKISIEDLITFKFEEELKISNILCKALKEMGKPMCVRVNEISFGIEAQLDDSEKKDLEKIVLDTIGYKITLDLKFNITYQERLELEKEFLWGAKDLAKVKVGQAYFISYLVENAYNFKMIRSNGHVLMPHATIPYTYVPQIEKRLFIDGTLKFHHGYEQANKSRLEDWFDNVDNIHFPLVNSQQELLDYISFTDGIWQMSTQTFKTWEEFERSKPSGFFYNRTYYEVKFEELEDKTPAWDAVLHKQLVEEIIDEKTNERKFVVDMKTIKVYEALTGRLFFPVGMHDGWQLVLYTKGLGQTGKGTITGTIQSMLPPGTVGVIDETQEEKFGLEAFLHSRAIVAPDASKNFAKVLKQSLLQSMVSGDPVSVACKQKKVVTLEHWASQMAIFSNYFLNYEDQGGQISRRIAAFQFVHKLEGSIIQTDMLKKIVADKKQVASIHVRCVRQYFSLLKEFGNKDFWTYIATPHMTKTRELFEGKLNLLVEFFQNGSVEWQVLKHPGAYTLKSELKTHFNQFLRDEHRHDKTTKVEDESHHLVNFNFIERDETRLCNKCKLVRSTQNCISCYEPNQKNCCHAGKGYENMKMVPRSHVEKYLKEHSSASLIRK